MSLEGQFALDAHELRFSSESIDQLAPEKLGSN